MNETISGPETQFGSRVHMLPSQKFDIFFGCTSSKLKKLIFCGMCGKDKKCLVKKPYLASSFFLFLHSQHDKSFLNKSACSM
jgi:hypothetical protein